MVAVGIAFEYFNFVFIVFCKTVSIFSSKRIKNAINPSEHSFITILKRFYTTDRSRINPFN